MKDIHIMRTNIDIDDDIMQAAMRGSEFKTKKDAVEAGLKLLARQAHYREVLKWEGKLHWNDQPDALVANPNMVMENIKPYGAAAQPLRKAVYSKLSSDTQRAKKAAA
jgi:antitoxin ParD1/3/4